MQSPKLRGIVPPLLTPLSENGTLDVAGLERLVEHVLAGGVHGLFLLGTTGEGPALPYSLRRDLVSRVCRQVAGRVPVLVSVTDTVFEETIAMAKFSAEQGAAAAVLAPPYYFPAQSSELIALFRRFSAESPLPFYLYNIPSLTKTWLQEDVIRAAMEAKNFLGLKDSSGDLQYFKRMRRVLGGGAHSLFMGPEELLVDCLLAGGDGGVSGGANAWPALYAEIFARATAGDWPGALVAQARVLEISRRVYSIGGYGSTVTRALKAALELEGICGSTMAPPHQGWGAPERETLRRVLAGLAVAA